MKESYSKEALSRSHQSKLSQGLMEGENSGDTREKKIAHQRGKIFTKKGEVIRGGNQGVLLGGTSIPGERPQGHVALKQNARGGNHYAKVKFAT